MTLGGNVSLGTGAAATRQVTVSGGTSLTDAAATPAINLTVNGRITGGTSTQNLTKAGTGWLVLSGANSYTGVTTVAASGGILQFAKPASLPSAANLVVNSGGMVAVNTFGDSTPPP